MTDHDLHTLTGAYAADALDADERAVFERHLETCDSCRQEVARAAGHDGPARGRRQRDAAGRRCGTGSSPRWGGPASCPRTVRSSGWTNGAPAPGTAQPATAAAAVLLVVAVGLGGWAVHEGRQKADAQRLAARIAAVAVDPQRTVHTAPVAHGGTGTVVAADGIAVFHGSDLPRLPDGQAYQLWRMSGQESQSAGVLGRGGELTGVVTDLGPGDAVGVSVEPAAGSSHPTSDPVFVVTPA